MKKRISLICLLLFVFLSLHAAAFADLIIPPYTPRPVQTAEASADEQGSGAASSLPLEPVQPENAPVLPFLLIGLAVIVLAIVIWRRYRLRK